MNKELWDKILAFDFDNPPSEYGFSIRLAKENYWTKTFTEQAILEYRKFMYLAATSEIMISPSQIVDIVWHQHLIFTQSYQEFCEILGKQIQHIPSTHNKEEVEKFKRAKERTIEYYERIFGEQPKNIWNFKDMFESLNLEKAEIKIRTFIIIGLLLFIFLLSPTYSLLKPIYGQIDNPYFIIGFICLTFGTFFKLELYNKEKIRNIVSQFDKTSFIYNLQPFELVYSKTQKLSNVINGEVNEHIDNGTIKVNSDNSMVLAKLDGFVSNEQLHIITVLVENEPAFYPSLLRELARKPIFRNTANCMDAFRKYFNKSKKFVDLFCINFTVLTVLLLLSFTRVVTGISVEKPVGQIVLATFILIVIMIIFLKRLTKQVSTTTIPDLYKKEILPARQIENNWQWNYFLFGPVVLTTSFIPLVKQIEKQKVMGSNEMYIESSCSSSSSSCGGCGGD